ncbi:ImmA/IrrE family metallo-endopeptidase [Oxalobacteraceae bacterium]|nr:ImmA/IrrE family metallo-endopeptidase [Oxalobacteraceae bacterium]
MILSSYKAGFRVKGLSVAKIRANARNVRELLMPTGECTDLEAFVENLENFGITYDVVDDSFLPKGTEASCIPEKRLIYISESTYAGICRNDERARFTIFHELGHLLLAHSRTFNREISDEFPIFENSEWQADQFAAEILMPLEIILSKGLRTAVDLQKEFGVSYQAAACRLKKLRAKREIKNA